jgi:hypothetical protein
MLRFYGVDLAGLWRGELSLRRLYVLVTNLPPGSACWAAESRVPVGTTPGDFVLADVFHALSGEAHPLRPAPSADEEAAKQKHESTVARLRAMRERVQTNREEAPRVGSE